MSELRHERPTPGTESPSESIAEAVYSFEWPTGRDVLPAGAIAIETTGVVSEGPIVSGEEHPPINSKMRNINAAPSHKRTRPLAVPGRVSRAGASPPVPLHRGPVLIREKGLLPIGTLQPDDFLGNTLTSLALASAGALWLRGLRTLNRNPVGWGSALRLLARFKVRVLFPNAVPLEYRRASTGRYVSFTSTRKSL